MNWIFATAGLKSASKPGDWIYVNGVRLTIRAFCHVETQSEVCYARRVFVRTVDSSPRSPAVQSFDNNAGWGCEQKCPVRDLEVFEE